jgi:hypothetical protein
VLHISFLNHFSFAAIQRKIEMVRKMENEIASEKDIGREIERGGDGNRWGNGDIKINPIYRELPISFA